MNFNQLDMQLLNAVSDLRAVPAGPVNIRRNGEVIARNSSSNITVRSKEDKPGLVVEVKPGTANETVHVPVILTKAGFKDVVYNTFVIGENSDVSIIAGCGIHNDSHVDSGHEGIHEIIVKKGARVRYIEKHYGQGEGTGKRILNPSTVITVENGGSAELEMYQIKGVDDTFRSTTAYIQEAGNLKIVERLLTHGRQNAESDIRIYIEGKGGSAQILSRSVAKDTSTQIFRASLVGKTQCIGHVECDSIIMEDARIKSTPELIAEDSEAVLTHEAAIGKIAGEQLIKLMSLGLTEREAIDTILEGFLR